jgi:enoyl-CoA hydratase
MEMVLTGEPQSARDMAAAGLVSRVLPPADLMPASLALAQRIASLSLPMVKLAKQSVLSSFDTTLHAGMGVERQLFQATFALDDQKVGMKAFTEKKKPVWKHQ